MKHIRHVPLTLTAILATTAMVMFGLAIAQAAALPEPSFDPRSWFGSAAALAAIVVTFTSLLKAHVLKEMTGLVTLAVSFGLGVGFAVIGSLIPAIGYEASIIEAATFGVTASVLASGGWDAVKGVLSSVLGSKS